ncbi:hypothetical protein Fot_32347 [Forsythia ovata]|uniref:Uncharacterized protein n=1 Tax=Forsythia ovata TaxID=205694 RepID=A0ABD1T7Y6_9LAMI
MAIHYSIYRSTKSTEISSRDVSIFQHYYHNLVSGILATGFIARCSSRFSEASGTETGFGQEGVNDYRDSMPTRTMVMTRVTGRCVITTCHIVTALKDSGRAWAKGSENRREVKWDQQKEIRVGFDF